MITSNIKAKTILVSVKRQGGYDFVGEIAGKLTLEALAQLGVNRGDELLLQYPADPAESPNSSTNLRPKKNYAWYRQFEKRGFLR